MSGDRIHVCPGPPTNGREYTALQYQVTMHNHNPTDTYDRLTGGEKESTISGQASDNGNKQDKEVASTTDNVSTWASLPQPNGTGNQQIAGNLLKVSTPPQREEKARLHLQHTSSEYPPPAVFTEIDISAVVGPMGNGKSTHLMTLAKFLATENYRVIALKHTFDTRCAPDKIGTHDHQLLSGSSISSLPTSIANTSQRTFFLIDEIQFFPAAEIAPFITMCRANNAQATLFGLDKDILTNTSFPAYEALVSLNVPIARRNFQKCNSCRHWATCNTPINQYFPLAWTTSDVIGGFEKWENACHQCAELWHSKWQNGSLNTTGDIHIRIHHETLTSPLALMVRDGTRIHEIRLTITSTLRLRESEKMHLIEILENPTTDVGTEPGNGDQHRSVGARLLSTNDKIIRHSAQVPRNIDINATYTIPATQSPALNTSNPWTMILLTPPSANKTTWRIIGINQATYTTNVLHTILDHDTSSTSMPPQHYQIRATNTSDGQGRVLSDSRPISQQDLRGGEIITAEPISLPTQELHGMQENDVTWGGEGYMSTQDRAIPPTAHNRTRQENHLDKQQNGGHANTRAHATAKDIQLPLPRNPTHTHYVRWLLTIESPSGSKWPSKLQPLSGSKWHVWVDNKTTIQDIKDAMCRTTPHLSPNTIDMLEAWFVQEHR